MYQDRNELFIGGEFVRAETRDRVDLVNPATEEVVGRVPDADADDVHRAVQAAQRARAAWGETSGKERADVLNALADGFDRRAHEIGPLVTAENGSPRWWTHFANESGPPNRYRNFAGLAASLDPEVIREAGGGRSLVRREPIGVVAAIVPWNAPQILLALKLGPALAAGCTVVVKPSPETSLDAYVLAEIIDEIGVPPGVVNIVTGGRGTGATLVSHEGVDKVSFTGSTRAGRSIAMTCGEQLKSVSAELGGKSAAVILNDADLDKFAASIVPQCVPYSGQVCYATTRVLVHRSRFEEVVECIQATFEESPFGEPSDPTTIFGPIVTAAQRDKVAAYIDSGVAEGATPVVGGHGRSRFARGYYVEPTIFVDVTPSMRIFQEEIFGPVLVVVPFADDDGAVELANDTTYGLAGAVFGENLDHAIAVARRIDTAKIAINGASGASGTSVGGHRNSGLGREGGLDPLANYQQLKNIALPTE